MIWHIEKVCQDQEDQDFIKYALLKIYILNVGTNGNIIYLSLIIFKFLSSQRINRNEELKQS